MTRSTMLYLTRIVGLLTWLLYNTSVPGHWTREVERIAYCNDLVSQMPERNQDEINQSINRFTDCLNNR